MLDIHVFSLLSFFTAEGTDVLMKATVLIIEDDRDIADLVGLYLGRDGIEVAIHGSGEEGLAAFDAEQPDLVVLDINLPGMDGYEVLQAIRSRGDVPVVMVTARQEDEDAILGFGMGADDYVSKPFSPKVLAARLRTHLSRVRKTAELIEAAGDAGMGSGADGRTVRFGSFILDRRTFTLLKDGRKVPMSPREIDLLLFLTINPGVPRSQDEIYHEVWGKEYGDLSTVAVHVQRIRKKIEDDPSNPAWLKTAHGRGYFFDGPEMP